MTRRFASRRNRTNCGRVRNIDRGSTVGHSPPLDQTCGIDTHPGGHPSR